MEKYKQYIDNPEYEFIPYNSEVEKSENAITPNGEFMQFNGKSHDSGGIPTNLDSGTMIFSDRLKMPGTKKTFAQLNKVNNTNKEDKILESNKHSELSKRTAELMKFAKNKNSEELFNEQESLKQAKVAAYAKRMGVIPNNEEYPMGGVKLPMYPYGGPTDNIKFTPAQRQQAYADSMTLYKSGFNKNIPNWKTPGFNEAVGRLHTLNGVVPQSTDKSSTAYANDANYLAQRSVPYAKPTAPVTQIPTVKSKPVYGNINMPMKGLENNVDINPQLQTVPTNRPSTIKTNIVTGPNMSYKEYKQGNEVLDRAYFDPQTKKEIELEGFKYGGKKLPKYSSGAIFTPKMASEDEGDNVIVPGNKSKTDSDFTEALGPDPHNTFGKPLDAWEAARLNKSAWDADYLNNPNAEKPTNTQESSKFDWRGLGSNVAMGLANNAGNIYNLSRYNKPEIEKYERMKATYLDPSAALRDATEQTRRAEYNVRGASGGNAGTYLSNRVALNAQNIINKDRIQKEYQNANAAIANNVGQYNNELARQEVIANAMNRARTRSGKGEAIGSIGSNIANQMMDNKKTNMDQETLQLMMKYYNDPQFKKYLEESGFNKKKTGK